MSLSSGQCDVLSESAPKRMLIFHASYFLLTRIQKWELTASVQRVILNVAEAARLAKMDNACESNTPSLAHHLQHPLCERGRFLLFFNYIWREGGNFLLFLKKTTLFVTDPKSNILCIQKCLNPLYKKVPFPIWVDHLKNQCSVSSPLKESIFRSPTEDSKNSSNHKDQGRMTAVSLGINVNSGTCHIYNVVVFWKASNTGVCYSPKNSSFHDNFLNYNSLIRNLQNELSI